MGFSGEGAFGGGMGGAGTGAAIGTAFAPGIGTAIGAGIGALAGALGGGFMGGKKQRTPDISAELARISALYAQARQAAIAGINREAGQGRRAAASNLAARGIYRSPASENTFGALEDARLGAISNAEGTLAAQEADTQAKLLQSLLGVQVSIDQQRAQDRAQLFGGLGAFGTQLLTASLGQRPGASTGMRPSAALGGNAYYVPGPFASPTQWPQAYTTPPMLDNALLLRALGGR